MKKSLGILVIIAFFSFLGGVIGNGGFVSFKALSRFDSKSYLLELRKEKLSDLSETTIDAIQNSNRERIMDIFADLNKWNQSAFEDKKVWLVISPADIKRQIKFKCEDQGIDSKFLLKKAQRLMVNN
ncbi:hypothetical protein [Maridesulfovibrio sp.]|uniref:hypothetical protein n=1 Tax=Maridesulfovibrio sp. TaxID=2795000 RepID=UPI0029CA10D3|nr:hypothetical protein [Maridesulfovibrio sp.]